MCMPHMYITIITSTYNQLHTKLAERWQYPGVVRSTASPSSSGAVRTDIERGLGITMLTTIRTCQALSMTQLPYARYYIL